MISNNVTRLLDSKKITYSAYQLPAEKLGAEQTALFLNVPLALVYKTIVVLREKPGKPILAVIPGTHEVNLKAVAAAVGEKKVHLATQAEAEKLTALQVGGISPLALIHKGFTILLDSSAQRSEHIHISGGQRGLNLRLAAADLIALTGARVADLV